MFYADNVLGRKGPLATIWLAAHWDRRLKKTQITGTNITTSLQDIITGKFQEMALRLSGQLLLGFVKIFHRQALYLYDDCAETLNRAKSNSANAKGLSCAVDLPKEQSTAAASAISVAHNFSDLDLMIPEPDLDSIFAAVSSNPSSQLGKSPSPRRQSAMHLDERLRAAKASIDQSLVQSLDFGDSSHDLENWNPNLSQRTRKSSIEVGRDAAPEQPFFSPSVLNVNEASKNGSISFANGNADSTMELDFAPVDN
jgi:cohesin complex subunit SCC1